MSEVKKQGKLSVSVPKLSGNGRKREKLNVSGVREDTDCTTSPLSCNTGNPIPEKNISMLESPPINKRATSSVKSNTSKNRTPNTPSSKKSPAGSTSKGKFSIGFWKKATTEWSKKLWFPTEIDCVESHSITSCGCLNYTESISWSSEKRVTTRKKNCLKTSFPSSTFSLAGTTIKGGELERMKHQKILQKTLQSRENQTHKRLKKEKKEMIPLPDEDYIPATTKVKILPTEDQKKKINDWIAAYRKTWNLSLHAVYEEKVKCTNDILRKRFVLEKHMTPENYERYKWLFRTGKRIREYGVKDLVSAYNSCQTRVKKKEIKQFRIGYKSKYDFKQTIPLSAF